jgi:hypothetical protein
MVEMSRQALVASRNASDASTDVVPGPAGSFINGAAHEPHDNPAASAQTRFQPPFTS